MMFVILAYDIGERRVGKASKIAKKYLYPMQRSLFHGYLTEKQLHQLKNELMLHLEPEKDAVIFYKIYNDNSVNIDEFGIVGSQDVFF